jgi:hypothetical protein
MATVWMKGIHRTSSGSISAAIGQALSYNTNELKTEGGELIATYECDPATADSEFMLSKTIYAQRTGRNQGKRDVIGYQLRQSFAPGEVTQEQALELGYELAMRWTKGKHQFVVAAHTNTNNPHTHIFINSVDLSCTRKWQDFKYSAIALRRVSDMICLEHGLSVIENPGLSKGNNRAEYLGLDRQPTKSDTLRKMLDDNIVVGQSLGDLLAKLKDLGCEVKLGKHYAVKIPGGGKFLRLDSLGDGYTQEHLAERLRGVREAPKRVVSGGGIDRKTARDIEADADRKSAEYAAVLNSAGKPNLLIDIQAKIREGKSKGYEQWAKIFNLKAAARTLIFLQKQGIDSYDDLEKKAHAVSGEYHSRGDRLRAIEAEQKSIAELQKQIGKYREVYSAYIKSGKDSAFYEANRMGITLCGAAKRYFDAQGFKTKLPSINSLKQQWATLDAQRKKLYPAIRN